jgi:chorismate dehydratase
LNARPLVYGLDERTDLFALRFDVPAKCASLLHEGAVDLGLIPSIEYLKGSNYFIVPDMAVSSQGPVASVALFTSRPTTAIRSVAVDSSSRTGSALLHVLCARWFDIEPKFVTMQPELSTMLKRCDAALLIGDSALFTDHESQGLDKIDLGEEWTAMTSLPFVWACWVGKAKAVAPAHLAALRAARDRGVAALDAIASQYGATHAEREAVARQYLHENVVYGLDEQAKAGLRKFFDAAHDLRIVPTAGALRFY